MDKRLGLALAISMGILILWWKIFPPPQPQPSAPPAPAVTQPASAPAPTTAGGGATATPTTPGAAPAANAPDHWESLPGTEADFVLSTWGATLRQVKVRDRDKKFTDVQAVRTYTP